jgi:hypothetical protein
MHAHFIFIAEWKNACSITTAPQVVKLNSMFRPNKTFSEAITNNGPRISSINNNTTNLASLVLTSNLNILMMTP